MDVSQLVQQKLTELGLEQRDLADAAEVTESYISQLLNRKKMPPAPERTLFISVASNGGTDEGRKGQNSKHRLY